MSDYDFPELPSDEELGITDADREAYEENPDDSEPIDKELAALLGDSPKARRPAGKADGKAASSGESGKPGTDRKAARAAKKAEKEAAKAARRQAKELAKEQKRQARTAAAAAAAAGTTATATAGTSPPGEVPTGSTAAAARSSADGGGAGAPNAPAAAGGPPVATPPKSGIRAAVTFATLLLLCVVASTRTGLPRPVPANASDTVFSSARAMTTLVEIAREAHPTGSPEHERVRNLLIDRLRGVGLDPEVQTATSVITNGNAARAATVRNIVARLPGTAPTGALLIAAHYDSREIAVGAADDGSGIVTIIEAVRALQAAGPLANDLIVLFTDGEELGLLGARAFVDGHRWMSDVDVMLNFEMRGAGGPSIMFETNESNGWVVRQYQDSDPKPAGNSLSYDVYKRLPNNTDFTPFREAGVQGLNFATLDNAHVYHQVSDTPDNLDESTLQHHGIHALAALKHFGNADLTSVDAPNQVYFTVPGIGLIAYGQSLVLPISALLILALVIMALAVLRAGGRPVRILLGTVVSIVAGASAYGLAVMLLGWLPGIHAEYGSLSGSMYHSEGWYVLALAFAAFTLVTTFSAITRRWIAPVEMAAGAVVLPTLVAVAASFATPLGAMNLQWPALFAVFSVIVVTILGRRAGGTVGWGTALILAAPVILLIQPVIELLWLAMSIEVAGVLAVFVVMALYLCLPALEGLTQPNRWWAPVTGAALAAATLGLGVLAARSNSDRPIPSTLVYAYEHGSGAAVWATRSAGDFDAPEARAWAVAQAGGDFTETRDLSDFGYPMGIVPVTRAAVVNATPPEVAILTDSVIQNERQVTLGVRSRIGAERLGFRFGGSTRLRAINGKTVDGSGTIREIDHWGVPDGSVLLDVSLAANDPIDVNVVEHLLRPEEVLGAGTLERPDDMAPDISRMSDRAMFRYSIAAFVDPRHAIVPRTEVVNPETFLPGSTPTVVPGDAPTDSASTESPPADTIPADTLTVEPPAVDTMVVDTVGVDTLAVDTVGVDTVSVTTPTTESTARGTILVGTTLTDLR